MKKTTLCVLTLLAFPTLSFAQAKLPSVAVVSLDLPGTWVSDFHECLAS